MSTCHSAHEVTDGVEWHRCPNRPLTGTRQRARHPPVPRGRPQRAVHRAVRGRQTMLAVGLGHASVSGYCTDYTTSRWRRSALSLVDRVVAGRPEPVADRWHRVLREPEGVGIEVPFCGADRLRVPVQAGVLARVDRGPGGSAIPSDDGIIDRDRELLERVLPRA
jgi:hypothetical protein